jgi:flagellar biosynthesis/type III secretory pathway M-ring protein FliF/YscJ
MDPGRLDTPEKGRQSSEPSSSPNVPVGAIVGGIIGGVTLIVIVTIILILIRRRRRKGAKANNANVSEGWNKAELPADNQGIVVRYEMDSNRQHEELPVMEMTKIAVGDKVQEERRHTKRYELQG